MRSLVATIDHEISELPSRRVTTPEGTTPPNELAASWAHLVELLALGPEPDMKGCPFCGHVGMRAATRCGYCWSKLDNPAEPGA